MLLETGLVLFDMTDHYRYFCDEERRRECFIHYRYFCDEERRHGRFIEVIMHV